MIKNFFKVAYRNLLRNKGFSLINITGLAIGMSAAILILLWIQDEVDYDEFHENKDRIYQVWNRVPYEGEISTWNSVPEPLAPALEKDLPEVERTVRVKSSDFLLSVGDKKVQRSGIRVDTGFLQMFSFPMLKGDPFTALNDIHSLVLTESTAKILFGDEDALGKIVKVQNKDNFTVTGIVKDPPPNTRLGFEYLVPWSYFKYGEGQDLGWNDNSIPTYVMLKPNASYASVAPKLKVLRQQYHEDAKKMKWELFMYPLSRWHLYSNFSNGVEGGGRITFVKLFGIIAVFILLIACINFMNLSTARSEKRAKEVGIRKAVGAQKSSLISQFIGESVFLALLSGIVAIIIVQLSLPAYNQLTDKELFINYRSIYTWVIFTGFILITGLLAGSYPAFFLSSFQPVKVLKGTFKKANALVTPRKVLVVLQFTFATILIICTIIVKQQIDYAREREMGYNKDNLVYHFMTGDIPKNYELIKNELLSSGIAKSITKTNSPITDRWSNGWGQSWEGKDPNDKTSFDRFLSDEGLGTTVGLQFVQGRDFNLKKFPTDSTGLIINESALKLMKFKDPIGRVVGDLGIDWHIVGVIKDFILTSPYEPTNPLLICGAKSRFMSFQVMQIKLNGNNATAKNLDGAEAIFRKLNPEYPFDMKFVDEAYARNFENEKLQGTLAALFAGLTIFISCLGLFGLATYMAENRVKEIGIRKILGASVTSITTLLSKDFVKLVLISFLVATPLAWWGMNKWLESYTYRVDIEWWVFALAGFLSVMIALLTVSYQSIRAAIANPVKSLKME
ncbi:FtsX-like permease family protein [Chitinophaga sp. SYP-B3965]|uniref:ABC transporter permease n=1 Tax=Chitinophaga sp. SYP-B3965 TaxID=2663120 RepID=UPI001299FFDE|nr:ABC transporter permease [Chitinophaga sp. SYP-B3965]MRG45273.1 FtsX-like permease family protein [Chitinophaga sp. SYP-B3965]